MVRRSLLVPLLALACTGCVSSQATVREQWERGDVLSDTSSSSSVSQAFSSSSSPSRNRMAVMPKAQCDDFRKQLDTHVIKKDVCPNVTVDSVANTPDVPVIGLLTGFSKKPAGSAVGDGYFRYSLDLQGIAYTYHMVVYSREDRDFNVGSFYVADYMNACRHYFLTANKNVPASFVDSFLLPQEVQCL
jgi:hypothetical protein